jgi:hypothetical protein
MDADWACRIPRNEGSTLSLWKLLECRSSLKEEAVSGHNRASDMFRKHLTGISCKASRGLLESVGTFSEYDHRCQRHPGLGPRTSDSASRPR